MAHVDNGKYQSRFVATRENLPENSPLSFQDTINNALLDPNIEVVRIRFCKLGFTEKRDGEPFSAD